MAKIAPIPPALTLLYSMETFLGERLSVGPIPTGENRIVIPIIGGTFKGPKMSGTIIPIGADWRLTDTAGKFRPDARYAIRTDDGTYIVVQTAGVPAGPDGRTMLRGTFETAVNGTYAWLNDVAAVGVLRRNGTASVIIEMWEVSPA
ncbi:hypothetical protein T440DRAFT_421863 [Plenodomus tracheiphilus IPT5]|uniref:Uncharacterized protein n=1 Tax=Plenodomus tracheiphilus IPT5 TaxID=1408161 RepID=A0A6A7BD32_9PLEO|nr:hypothetical protein T440DRAFT_421863 [Plenodomus tracheiphilus IPT5]